MRNYRFSVCSRCHQVWKRIDHARNSRGLCCHSQTAADLTPENPNTDGGLSVSDLGSVISESLPKAGARTYMPQGARVTAQPSNTSGPLPSPLWTRVENLQA